MLNDKNQQKLIEMVVGKVLDKHQVKTSDTKLTQEEKANIKGIVENIQTEVEKFLENKQVTERDFAENSPGTGAAQTPNRKKFQQKNDVNTVKTFINKFK